MVARCNNREFCFAMAADFELLLAGGAEGQRSRGEGDSAEFEVRNAEGRKADRVRRTGRAMGRSG